MQYPPGSPGVESTIERILDSVALIIHSDKFVVYGHFLPGQEQPFYVGSGTFGRAFEAARNNSRNPRWRELVASCKKFEARILVVLETREEAYRVEEELIRKWQPATNVVGHKINEQLKANAAREFGLAQAWKRATRAPISAAQKDFWARRKGIAPIQEAA